MYVQNANILIFTNEKQPPRFLSNKDKKDIFVKAEVTMCKFDI